MVAADADVDDWGLSNEVNWDFGAATLTSITAYRGHPTLVDYASTKGAIVTFTPFGVGSE